MTGRPVKWNNYKLYVRQEKCEFMLMAWSILLKLVNNTETLSMLICVCNVPSNFSFPLYPIQLQRYNFIFNSILNIIIIPNNLSLLCSPVFTQIYFIWVVLILVKWKKFESTSSVVCRHAWLDKQACILHYTFSLHICVVCVRWQGLLFISAWALKLKDSDFMEG